ncbi:thermonuclease family protein [Microcoleus sp. FACHB-831]|uniref:thermonuclease family protein n=1 Tax=Microcoleus sp. FACHB-831 TaxID=2692827 RepID=UPI002814ECAF|nr:thermonuclease family protein [Microcoleus sp. FACHB-831]
MKINTILDSAMPSGRRSLRLCNAFGFSILKCQTNIYGGFQELKSWKYKTIWRTLRHRSNIILAFACSLLLVGCQSTPPPVGMSVKIERVVNGQSVEVIDNAKQPPLLERLRLIGVEAPDMKQRPWGHKAQERLEQLIGGQPVILESDEETKDRYERRLAYLWRDRVLLNETLIREGYALFVPRSPNNKYDQRLSRAQEEARLMGRGIWNPKQPMRLSPSEFRRQYR